MHASALCMLEVDISEHTWNAYNHHAYRAPSYKQPQPDVVQFQLKPGLLDSGLLPLFFSGWDAGPLVILINMQGEDKWRVISS